MSKSPRVVLLSALLQAGCATQPALTSPPTWVLAFSEGSIGQPATAQTIESMDGISWFLKRPALNGPVAHDGRITWMQISAVRHLRYRVGAGGTASPVEGIYWSTDTELGATNILAEKQPGLAFGNGRWVTAFRGQGTDTGIYFSQQPSSGGNWSGRTAIHPGGTPATTRRAPALAFGLLNGQGTFTLAYIDANNQAVVSTSTDLMTWTAPAAIAEAWKDPALVHKDDNLYALLSRPDGNDNRYIVYKSADGIHWTEIGNYAENPPPGSAASFLPPDHVERNRFGPAFAVEGCRMVVVEAAVHGRLQIRDGSIYQPCDNPTTVVFSASEPLRLQGDPNTNLVWNGPVALAFGKER